MTNDKFFSFLLPSVQSGPRNVSGNNTYTGSTTVDVGGSITINGESLTLNRA